MRAACHACSDIHIALLCRFGGGFAEQGTQQSAAPFDPEFFCEHAQATIADDEIDALDSRIRFKHQQDLTRHHRATCSCSSKREHSRRHGRNDQWSSYCVGLFRARLGYHRFFRLGFVWWTNTRAKILSTLRNCRCKLKALSICFSERCVMTTGSFCTSSRKFFP